MSAPTSVRNWPRLVVSVVVVLVLAIGVGLWWYREHRTGVTFAARFTASVGVYPGSDVRILGVPVGTIDSVTPEGDYVRVEMHLNPGVNVAADTSAVIISPNLVSDRYVQLTGVYSKGPKLTSGTTIHLSHTRTPVELDDLYRSLLGLTNALGPKGANSSGALTRLIDTGAVNLKGNGRKLNATISQLSAASSTLAGSKDDIFGTIDHLSSFTDMLKRNNSGLVTVNEQLASVSQTLSDDRETFGEAVRRLGTALTLVQTFVHNNRAALSSNIARLSRVAGSLATERTSLLKALSAAPLLVQNFINAYDPSHNVLRGRADLNELTVWANQAASGGSSSRTAASSGSTVTAGSAVTSGSTVASGTDAPPTLLPSSNVTTGGDR